MYYYSNGIFDYTFYNIFDYFMDFDKSINISIADSFKTTSWEVKDNNYILKIDVPGYEKSEIKLSVESDNLIIECKNNSKGLKTYKLKLPDGLNDNISADLKLGELIIFIKIPENKKTSIEWI